MVRFTIVALSEIFVSFLEYILKNKDKRKTKIIAEKTISRTFGIREKNVIFMPPFLLFHYYFLKNSVKYSKNSYPCKLIVKNLQITLEIYMYFVV